MTPENIQELKKICVMSGCKKRRLIGKALCEKHQHEFVNDTNPTAPKAPDPRYKEL